MPDPKIEKPELRIRVQSPEETDGFARAFAKRLETGSVVALYGDLGSGKTFLVKSICRELGCVQPATSPTFTIINEYHTTSDLLIYHFDFYRLENEAELQNLGLDDFFYDDFICLVEWADKIHNFLPEKRWDVFIDFIPNQPESREIAIFKRK